MQIDILSQDAGHFAGRITSPLGNFDISGSVTSNTLRWEMKAKKPMPITVTFVVEVSDDTMRGTAKLGMLGKSVVTGQRIAREIREPAERVRDLDDIGEVTEDFVDPRFAEPYVAVDEMRTEPVPHRYVHGGFTGTDARFSFYFPPPAQYQGRFFHNTYPMITDADVGPFPIQFEVAVGDIGFTIDSGAYYVQTNLGGADRAPPADPAIAAYRVNAAAAKYSRVVASEYYGAHRPYGYLFGGSGGSYQVIGSAENTQGVWDGFLPYVIGSPHSIPSMFTVRQHALRVLRAGSKSAGIIDALDPGGSGDPYAGLNAAECAALREAMLLGYPLRGWWNHEVLTSGYFTNVAPLVPMLDPSYLDDFWSKPGYLGHDDPALQSARFQFDTVVAATPQLDVTDRHARHVVLDAVPQRDFADAHLGVLSGKAAGSSLPIAWIDGNTLGFAFASDHSVIERLSPGDRVRIDNSWTLALQTYHRHQVPPSDEFYGWNQFRGADGQPIYPQREILIGPIGAGATAGTVPEGNIRGKMLVLECTADIDALPWQADWYRTQVKKALGERFENDFAIWFIDNAQHENPLTPAAHANTVSFAGALQQGLRDLAAWVERGERPADTRYSVVDSQIVLPDDASDRGGIQPVLRLTANDGLRAEVAVGEVVRFVGEISAPSGMGAVVDAEWDFEGLGDYPYRSDITAPQATVRLLAEHAYARPGTYFPVLRAATHRDGVADTRYARVQNLARVRVVVRP
ncbi:MAG: hypothetical protein AB7U35_05010 [Sphingobium sp.]